MKIQPVDVTNPWSYKEDCPQSIGDNLAPDDFGGFERDLSEDYASGDNLSWVGGLLDIPNSDLWVENMGFPDEYINAKMYAQIQSEGNWRFERDWDEKMKRQRDGIE